MEVLPFSHPIECLYQCMFFSRSEFIILSHAADSARITRGVWFRFGHKSFYQFGIRSCLATSHKQILKMPFSITSSCIWGFQVTRSHSSSVYCTLANHLANCNIFLRQILAGLGWAKDQSVQWSHGPVVKGLTFYAGGSCGAGSNPCGDT